MHRRNFMLSMAALAASLSAGANGQPQSGSEAAWDALKKSGYTILMRHAEADPGVGEPAEFQIESCRTQRNLSAKGKLDARYIGEGFRRRHIPVGEIWSSHWCPCLDTARLAFGRVSLSPMLNSIFEAAPAEAERQTAEVRRFIQRPPTAGNRILVTHERNIHALTGISPAAGGMVIVDVEADGALHVVGRIEPSL